MKWRRNEWIQVSLLNVSDKISPSCMSGSRTLLVIFAKKCQPENRWRRQTRKEISTPAGATRPRAVWTKGTQGELIEQVSSFHSAPAGTRWRRREQHKNRFWLSAQIGVNQHPPSGHWVIQRQMWELFSSIGKVEYYAKGKRRQEHFTLVSAYTYQFSGVVFNEASLKHWFKILIFNFKFSKNWSKLGRTGKWKLQ